jgi:hypothetical protein
MMILLVGSKMFGALADNINAPAGHRSHHPPK